MAESYFLLQWLQAMFVGTSAAAYALANNNNKENNRSGKTTPPPPPPRRLLRSVLYVPASDTEGMRQALLSAADAVVLDLEDTVAPHDKDVARAMLTMGSKRRSKASHVGWLPSAYDKSPDINTEVTGDTLLLRMCWIKLPWSDEKPYWLLLRASWVALKAVLGSAVLAHALTPVSWYTAKIW